MTETPSTTITPPNSHDLLDWYDVQARRLPWRIAPDDSKQGVLPDPYHVWLSEIMLQQTTVAAVKAYYEKFITIWPKVTDLAAADQEDVMKAWAGLGYYSRARNLHKCAQLIINDYNGTFPETAAELVKLPGVGAYTSAAIASIAFREPVAVVDGNVERVFTRLFAIDTPLPAAKEDVRERKQVVLPIQRPGDFAQAVMDLGATICTPKRPACALCCWNSNCQAFAEHDPEHFPVKAPKKTKPTRKGAAFVLLNQKGAVWLEKRGPSGLLASMTQIPTTDWNSNQDGGTNSAETPIGKDLEWTHKGMARHTFTHFHLELEIYQAVTEAADKLSNGWWCEQADLKEEALPTVMKKAIRTALPDAFKASSPQ